MDEAKEGSSTVEPAMLCAICKEEFFHKSWCKHHDEVAMGSTLLQDHESRRDEPMASAAVVVAPFPELVLMMEQAKREGLWFHCSYQDLWFSPVELEQQWANERFRWGAANWTLSNPHGKLRSLASAIQHASNDYDAFRKRMENAR